MKIVERSIQTEPPMIKSQIPMSAAKTTINKLMVSPETRLGTRLWHRGAYYRVIDVGGKGLGEHWVLEIDEVQDHVNPPK